VTIGVFNPKGGCGRTTVAVNLAAALATAKRRVLLVDLDSSASASVWCGVSRRNLRPSAASCLLDKFPLVRAIRQTDTPHFDLVSGSIELANADVALSAQRGRELAVRRLLERANDHYDLILIDCPPGLSLLGINAIVAADALVVPVTAEPLCVEGLGPAIATIDRVRTRIGSHSRVLGILLTMVEPSRRNSRELCDRVRAEFRDAVFHTELRWTRALADAPGSRKNVFAFAPRSSSVDAFRRLAGEVLQRLPSVLR
jgi:chromosome partitioning protein